MYWRADGSGEKIRSGLQMAMKLSASPETQPEHFLIAMLQDESSTLSRCCLLVRSGVKLKSLHDMLVTAATPLHGALPIGNWSEAMLSQTSRSMVEQLRSDPDFEAAEPVSQAGLLAAAALEAAPSRVQRVFTNMGIDDGELLARLRDYPGKECPKPEVFDKSGRVNLEAFNASGRSILRLVESEGKGMGLKRIGTPLLLFAFVSRDSGVLTRALRLQVAQPRQVHEALLLQLRALGTNRFNEDLRLTREAMQSSVAAAFDRAADLAHERRLATVGEAELLRALLVEDEFAVRSTLEALQVDMLPLSQFVMQRHSGEADEQEAEASRALPSLEEIQARLVHNVVGQNHVVEVIMPVLKRMRFGYPRPNRPMAVLLFLGNSGTGKTQMAKEIAQAMYGSEDQMIFLEMGQFGTEYSKTIFVGAPPGLVGYGEGLLTNGLRDKPESVVLFDEVEKAHKSVFDVLLRFLDEGQIADPAGPVRDGRRCIIILTSNHALDVLQPLIERQTAAIDMSVADREAVRQEVRRAVLATDFFRPEFLNRVDELLLFNVFDANAYRKILSNQLEREKQRLQEEKELEVHFSPTLVEALVDRCVERSDEGARVCGKLISDFVVTPLIDYFIDPEHKNVRSVEVLANRDGGIVIQEKETAAAVAP